MRGFFSYKIYIYIYYINITFIILFSIEVKSNEIDFNTLSDSDVVYLRFKNLPDNTKCHLIDTTTGTTTDSFGTSCEKNFQNKRTCKKNECWTTVYRIKKEVREISCRGNNNSSIKHTFPLNDSLYSLLRDNDLNCYYMLIPFGREEESSTDKTVDFVLSNVPDSEKCTLNGKKPISENKSEKHLTWNIIKDSNNYSIQCKEKADIINFDEKLGQVYFIKNYQSLKPKEKENSTNIELILLDYPLYEKNICKIDSKLGRPDAYGYLRWDINQSQLNSSYIFCGNRKGPLGLSKTYSYSSSSSTYQGLKYLDLPNFISIYYNDVSNDNEAKAPFPDETIFELKVPSFWYTLWNTKYIFQLKSNNVIDKKVLNLFKNKYDLYNKDSFDLKIHYHPDLPEEIFQEYQFNSNIYSEIVFTLYPFAKVKKPYPSFNDKIVTFYPENY